MRSALASRPEPAFERGYLSAGNTASGRDIAVPYMIKRGAAPGPCLWVNAAVHGDEINGVFAAVRFIEALVPAEMRGSVVVTPVANVLALDERRKTSAIDAIDMDQSFPGRASGFPTERMAAALFRRFGAEADVVVNLHTLGTPFDASPYAVYKLHPNGAVDEQAILDHVACFAPTIACRMPTVDAAGELPGNITGGLDYQSLARGAIAFMIELGGGGRLEQDAIAHGADGLRRLATRMSVVAGGEEGRPASLRRVTSRAHRLVETGGLFEAVAAPGRSVGAGTLIGRVRNIFGDVVEEVSAERETWVIAVRRDPVVHSGDRVAFLGLDWGEVDVSP